MLQVKFWGVRGSIPAPLSTDEIALKIENALRRAVAEGVRTEAEVEHFLQTLNSTEAGTYGGNTSCVSIVEQDEMLILDAGSGLRRLGGQLAAQGKALQDSPIRILLTHFHWDHIMGFAFFIPAFIPGNHIKLYSPKSDAQQYFSIQHGDPFFPVELEHMGAQVDFVAMHGGRQRKIGHYTVKPIKLKHPGGGLGYRITGQSGTVVYLTDTEIELKTPAEVRRYTNFARGADLAIVDSQYGIIESIEKLTWGHSSVFRFIDLLHDADVKRMAMFHYDPETSDNEVDETLESARTYAKKTYPDSKMQIEASDEGEEVLIG